jgi:hypothetical protein
MLALTREKLIAHLQGLPPLIDRYQRRDPSFGEEAAKWLASVEQTLLQFRSPLASLVSVSRGRIHAVADGYRDPTIMVDHRNRRKSGSATILLVVGHVEGVLRGRVNDIDAKLDDWRAKMAEFLAVATSNGSDLPQPTEPREAWLQTVWRSFSVSGEAQRMYNYLNVSMSRFDRLYVLNELVENFLNGH